MTIPKEELEQIKNYLEAYQEDLLKIKHRPAGQVVNMRCNMSELINSLNLTIGNLLPVLAHELSSQIVGNLLGRGEKYQEKTSKEIIESIESQLCTTNLASYCLEPIVMGLWELKKRLKE